MYKSSGILVNKFPLDKFIMIIIITDKGRREHLQLPKKKKDLVKKVNKLAYLNEIEVECEIYGVDENNKLVITKLTKHE